MVAVYILLNEDETFHTIIVKKKYNDFTYIAFLGYSGGGQYDEFYAKTKYNDELGLTGFYSRSNGSGEWENKLLSLKFDDETEKFINESEELFDFMDKDDQKIQFELLNEINKYVYHGYDEESDQEFEYPVLKDLDFSVFKKFENSDSYYNGEWNDEFLEITVSDLWELSISFPHVIENYL